MELKVYIDASPRLIGVVERLASAFLRAGVSELQVDFPLHGSPKNTQVFDDYLQQLREIRDRLVRHDNIVANIAKPDVLNQICADLDAKIFSIRPLSDRASPLSDDPAEVVDRPEQASETSSVAVEPEPHAFDQSDPTEVVAGSPEKASLTPAEARAGMPWEPWEDDLIRSTPGSLNHLAEKLQRTVKSVSVHRAKLNGMSKVQPPIATAPASTLQSPTSPAKPPTAAPPPSKLISPPVQTRTATVIANPAPTRTVTTSPTAVPRPASVVPKFANPVAVNGKQYATFAEVKAWAAHFRLNFDGGNMHLVNKLRAQFHQPELVVKS